uniref:Uncharacterized protein n=1 Tax=Tanacetum cinerariifolium TaxID=118510 RepID=A0A699H1F5_TANCI|nr:hypothetical protein [Tanacetum cinerariifolium]
MSTSNNTTFEFEVHHNGSFKLNPLTYQNGSILNLNVLLTYFEDIISYLTRKISRRFTTLSNTLPPSNALSGLKQIKNDYDTNVIYDIARVVGKIQLFVSHHQIDLSTMLIPDDGSLEEALEENVKLSVLAKLQDALHEEDILADQILTMMQGYDDRFTNGRVEINNLIVLQDHPLVDYDEAFTTNGLLSKERRKNYSLTTLALPPHDHHLILLVPLSPIGPRERKLYCFECNFPSLGVNLGDKRSSEPSIKPHSPGSFRMKIVEPLTIHTPPLPHTIIFDEEKPGSS